MHFLQARHNRRTDEYGGSLIQPHRLLRELIEETKEAVGADCAVALRFAVDELRGADGIAAESEGREVVEMLAELPDLWDVNVSTGPTIPRLRDCGRRISGGFRSIRQDRDHQAVVGVGRFTSPDTMVSQIRRGILDMIGLPPVHRRSLLAEKDRERG